MLGFKSSNMSIIELLGNDAGEVASVWLIKGIEVFMRWAQVSVWLTEAAAI